MSEQTETSVKITVDGVEIEARPDELVIAAAERHGTYIPRFCWHPRMNPVGMCRMCIVEIDTGRGPALQPSCMIPVSDGMEVVTDSEVTKKAQDGVLEFLLANHPLDCPVCDKGGECPLQDQAYAYGPGESRFVEEKRHFEKPIPISDLVDLDRERCILCDRCTRFADEVAGDPLISFIDRGSQTQVNTFPDDPFASYFSGNTVQICPVGALTAQPYRFKARPWDLDQVESTCTSCSVGCRVVVQASRNEVLRTQGVDIDAVNWSWLCDKGRFDFQSIHHEDRLAEPLLRVDDVHERTSWAKALGATADAVRDALDTTGPSGIGVVGGARLTNEAAYAWAKLTKGVIGTDNVDCQLGDGLDPNLVLGLPKATIDETCAPGGTIVVLGIDVKEELPVLYLRLRHAVVEDGATLVEIVPHSTGLSHLAAHTLTYTPGSAAAVARSLVSDTPVAAGGIDADAITAAKAALGEGRVRVVVGRGNLAESGEVIAAATGALHDGLDATFLSGLRRGNVHGALDAGLSPGLLPGRVGLDEGRAHFHETWSTVPADAGLDTVGILQAAADGKLDVLVLLGADPLTDFPDHDLARRALAGARTVIAVDTLPSASVKAADVVLPAAGYAETEGTTTNLEGRVSKLSPKVTPPGTARSDWTIAAELAFRLGDDLGLESVGAVFAELTTVSAAHRGLTLDAIGLDGVVVPVDAPTVETESATPDSDVEPEAAEAAVEAETAESGEQTEEADAEAAAEQADAEADHAATDDADEVEATDDAGDIEDGDVEPAPETFSGPEVGAGIRFVVPEVDVPQPDGYRLRLVTTRSLYDLGSSTQASPSLAKLPPGAVLFLHPHDFDRLGVPAGGNVKVSNTEGGRSSVAVTVQPADGVPKGAARIAYAQPGGPTSELIDATRAVTDVRVEVAP